MCDMTDEQWAESIAIIEGRPIKIEDVARIYGVPIEMIEVPEGYDDGNG